MNRNLNLFAALLVCGVDTLRPTVIDVLGGCAIDLVVEPRFIGDDVRRARLDPLPDLVVRRQEVEHRQVAEVLLGHQIDLVLDRNDTEVVDALRVQANVSCAAGYTIV